MSAHDERDCRDLELQLARLQAILDAAADGLITFDEHGTITHANEPIHELLGYTEGQLTGGNIIFRKWMPVGATMIFCWDVGSLGS